ncbi:HAD hydrolase family protein [Streptomyces sp. PSKA54]|uniref:HAD hydrolase family protein n=1 Tax=Streptomyces himalayensis subsp. aureolus TaxID=2758039 RepID=A0A7W2D1N0_9ACTN|nr:HAD hydrolase family protein [Streptomyces himalayensis]MBA4862976.1 HAD hydrolase family protein [Streptomyces himalayensis subsp. aureolus]
MRDTGVVTSATARPRTPASSVPPRLIATDLDGTLLRDDKSVSERTIAALAAAEAAGIEVFFVTGRPARWMDVVSDHVHGHGLAICGNGAAVVDLHGGPGSHRFVKIRALEPASALDVVHTLRAAAPGTSFAVERTGGLHHEPTYPPLQLDPGESVAPAEKLLAEDSDVADQPVLKLLAHHPTMVPDEFLTLARAHAADKAAITRSSPSALLEISGPGVSKASTLALCCAERGITPQEVMAFGDMPNDVEMLTWAGTSYAMGNAHPDVVAVASGHTVANNEDGVAIVIEGILAGL